MLLNLNPAPPSNIQFYLTPASQTVPSGTTLTTQIRIQDPTAKYVNYARAVLAFPADKLAVTGISSAGSDFVTSDLVTYDNSAGTVQIVRETKAFNYQATDFLLATITFQTKNAGLAPISFGSNSSVAVTAFNSSLLTGMAGAAFTINPPAPVVSAAPISNVPTPLSRLQPPATTSDVGRLSTPTTSDTPPKSSNTSTLRSIASNSGAAQYKSQPKISRPGATSAYILVGSGAGILALVAFGAFVLNRNHGVKYAAVEQTSLDFTDQTPPKKHKKILNISGILPTFSATKIPRKITKKHLGKTWQSRVHRISDITPAYKKVKQRQPKRAVTLGHRIHDIFKRDTTSTDR